MKIAGIDFLKEYKIMNKTADKIIKREKEMVSNCCSAPVYEDTDICTGCKEHCLPVDDTICDKCGSDLVVETNDLDNEGQFSEVITKCPNCD